MTRRIPLEKLAGEIEKLTLMRSETQDIDEWCSYTLQLRHYKKIYWKMERLGMTIEQIRDYNDGGTFV